MSHIRAVIKDIAPFKAGGLVRSEIASNGYFDLRRGNSQVRVSREDYVEHTIAVPNVNEVLFGLKAKAKISIIWNSEDGRFRVVGFRFGEVTRISVPTFEDGKVAGARLVTTTRHVNIEASTFDLAVQKLFARCAQGDLYGYYDRGKVERLFWDEDALAFRTEVTKLKAK